MGRFHSLMPADSIAPLRPVCRAPCKIKTKLPAWITVASLACSFVLTLLLANSETAPERIVLFEWINVHWGGRIIHLGLKAIDSLSVLWMRCFVTGLGTLIALYASEYMEPDVGSMPGSSPAVVSSSLRCAVWCSATICSCSGLGRVGFASYWLIGYCTRSPKR